ncbi:nucleotidyltransferase domain-containing protein [Amycolatopsis tolypomycina]|uniref:Aminoglycoside-2''-adenylyltransferase n=1 Tax=Amycolatopsis tolypomycina TaxID=208445 RepID=A0A1H5A5F9_9PSEU|nr:amino acid transporter [Amycolatopsis tolypomycina]SED36951.1 Aminoglycoside-2''-adenylyltransferase [Amycolatopsis tolypomycina]
MTWEPASLPEVAELLAQVRVPWWIAGGYAIELAVGRAFREHSDVDVLLLRRDQRAIQEALPSWEWWAADPPGTLRPWAPGEVLGEDVDDVWCRPSPATPWRIQFMLDNAEGDEWVSRRNPAVRREVAALGAVSRAGIPYLAPEVQLFAKAHRTRPKDELDFAAALPVLDAAQRRWLAEALDDDHPWLGRL